MNDDPNLPTQGPAISRADGVTESERYLKTLCDRTFLSLWSYPGVYRDQGRIEEQGEDDTQGFGRRWP